jgi:hypothetical protein
MWQEVGVVLIVAGAVAYLARKLFGIGPKPRPKRPPSFVPLSELKRRR